MAVLALLLPTGAHADDVGRPGCAGLWTGRNNCQFTATTGFFAGVFAETSGPYPMGLTVEIATAASYPDGQVLVGCNSPASPNPPDPLPKTTAAECATADSIFVNPGVTLYCRVRGRGRGVFGCFQLPGA